ncbi:hypothetical protein C8R42DRAFT_719786 [Lentinula raphanica]|nr:hypothetical protein C8R42DRAFT_719786 [Lentinula raphanica]
MDGKDRTVYGGGLKELEDVEMEDAEVAADSAELPIGKRIIGEESLSFKPLDLAATGNQDLKHLLKVALQTVRLCSWKDGRTSHQGLFLDARTVAHRLGKRCGGRPEHNIEPIDIAANPRLPPSHCKMELKSALLILLVNMPRCYFRGQSGSEWPLGFWREVNKSDEREIFLEDVDHCNCERCAPTAPSIEYVQRLLRRPNPFLTQLLLSDDGTGTVRIGINVPSLLHRALSRLPSAGRSEKPGTLVVVPPHLTRQWDSEVRKFTGKHFKTLVLSTVSNLNSATIDDFQLEADIIIVASNIFKNSFSARISVYTTVVGFEIVAAGRRVSSTMMLSSTENAPKFGLSTLKSIRDEKALGIAAWNLEIPETVNGI